MREVRRADGVYAYVGELPQGCRLCMKGAKSVIFITGLCDDQCPYCPVLRVKLGRDVSYVNEEEVRGLEEVLDEVERSGSEGAGITGGDPLLVLPRLLKVVRALKDHLGEDFHIHLYTTGRYATSDVLKALEEAGVDEIRFHPVREYLWSRVARASQILRKTVVGVEVPVFPDRVEELKRRILWLDAIGVSFINLNEVEVTPDNLEYMLRMGYKVRDYTIEGSYEAGLEVVEWAAQHTRRISVHFCPAVFKDSVQMRLRMLRKALRSAKPYEQVTPQGTLLFVEVPVSSDHDTLVNELVSKGYGEVVRGRLRTCMHMLKRLHKRGGVEIVEVPPTENRLPVLTRKPTADD